MLKLITKYQRGNVVPVRATPTWKKKKSWESEEDYQDRIAWQSKVNMDSLRQEQLKARQLEIKKREEYLNSKEGQLRLKKLQNEDSQFFSNIKVTPNTNNSLQRKANLIQNAMQADINTVRSINVGQAVRNQRQKKLDKWKDYKNGLDATLTAIELGLSGGSILGAYSNWRKWKTAASTTKRAVANFLQKAQLPMQVGGTLIDGYQTQDAIQNNDTFETAWNATSGTLGVAGTLGASDVTRFHNPKIDSVLDILGLAGNAGDFIKFGISKYNDKRCQNGGSFTTGALADMIMNRDNYPNQVKYGNGNYNNVNTALFSKYKPTGKYQHRDDRVKLINHPTHPKRGRFTKDGMKFYMSDFGMNNPNLTLFGAPDNYPDGQTTMIYKGGVVLPEITVTPTQAYIDNPYDQYKIYLKK